MESSESGSFVSFKSKKVLHSSSKHIPSDQGAKSLDQSPWSSKTPEKPQNPPRRARSSGAALSVKEVGQFAEKLRKSDSDPPNQPAPSNSAEQRIASSETQVTKSIKADDSVKLPEKYEILDKFFNSLDSSIRLLRLKGSMSTFTNISPKIECLTDRRFSHGHLAQLKFILPEAIEIEKVLVHDERTSCMKPDLHVTLNINAVENDRKLKKSDSGNLRLRKVFRARLLDFFKAHPEEDEVPEETLPEPFNQSKQDLCINTIKASNLSIPEGDASINALSGQQPASAAHLSLSFRRHFSKQVSSHEALDSNKDQSSSEKEACTSTTPIKKLLSTKNEDCSSMGTASKSRIQETPAKLTSTPAKLMSATPALQPPKRCYMTPDDDSTRSPNKLVRRTQRSRSLRFDTPVKSAEIEDDVCRIGRLSVDNDIFEILPESLLQSIREKERKALEEQDPAISQAKRRQQMIASLPKLFDMLHFLFQSIKRSIITKEELMHRIISSRLDIIDRKEVDEQLRLLQELVPEWISEKFASSGDLLLCINNTSSSDSIRARLAEAK